MQLQVRLRHGKVGRPVGCWETEVAHDASLLLVGNGAEGNVAGWCSVMA